MRPDCLVGALRARDPREENPELQAKLKQLQELLIATDKEILRIRRDTSLERLDVDRAIRVIEQARELLVECDTEQRQILLLKSCQRPLPDFEVHARLEIQLSREELDALLEQIGGSDESLVEHVRSLLFGDMEEAAEQHLAEVATLRRLINEAPKGSPERAFLLERYYAWTEAPSE